MAEPQTKLAKVLLWAAPRSMSTSFLKCFTSVPNSVAWMEPWRQVHVYGKEDEVRSPFLSKMMEAMGGKDAVDKIPGGYDASDKTYAWIKHQLEGDYIGKELIFVKELTAFAIDKLDTIPKGFRHTFLIRHPAKTVVSFFKLMSKHPSFKVDLGLPEMLERITVNFNRPNICKDSYEMLQHVKENLEPNPIIIDSDEFLQDPPRMLEAYCKAVGIPYSSDLLTWEAGDDVMTKNWMVSKQVILTYPSLGAHEGTFKSTGFQKKEKGPLPDLSAFPPAAEQFVAMELPYYEKMYAERLTL